MTVRAIIFDCGGVLLQDRPDSAYPVWEARLGLQPGALKEHLWGGEAWHLAERGRLSERDFWSRAGAGLGLTDKTQVDALRQDLWDTWQVDPLVLSLVERARKRYRVAVLSNATDVLEEHLRGRFGIADRFDVIVNSARLGIAKPDRRIFEETLRLLGIAADEAVFVDDRAENVAAAASLGMHVVWFVGSEELGRQLAVYLDHDAARPGDAERPRR
jgi:putative hydrolase of the HAD superfamily